MSRLLLTLVFALSSSAFADSYSTLFNHLHRALYLSEVEALYTELCRPVQLQNEVKVDCFSKSSIIEHPTTASVEDLKAALKDEFPLQKGVIKLVPLKVGSVEEQVNHLLIHSKISKNPELQKLGKELTTKLNALMNKKGSLMFDGFAYSFMSSAHSLSILVQVPRYGVAEIITLSMEVTEQPDHLSY